MRFQGGTVIWRVLLILIVLVVAAFWAARSLFAGVLPAVGSVAPDFTLSSQEGTPVSLKDYRGQWVVLYFYPKDFTSGCTREAHNFQRDQSQYSQRNAVVLGVSLDSADSHKRFCAKENLNFKLLADTSHQTSRAYGSLLNLGVLKFALRHTFLIDPEGRIARSFTEVDPNLHSQQVLASLDALQKNAR
jgi:thioredoxin-dependent peroxiredoxin